jgi:hypothetical protein
LLLVASLIVRTQDAYLEALKENGRAVQGLADLLTARVAPVYRKYATKLGLSEEAFTGFTARTEELRALGRQLARTLTSDGRG